MRQEERWLVQWKAVMDFMEKNHRNPSKYAPEERNMLNWCKQQRKLINAGTLISDRVALFEKLQGLAEKYKRVNQYK